MLSTPPTPSVLSIRTLHPVRNHPILQHTRRRTPADCCTCDSNNICKIRLRLGIRLPRHSTTITRLFTRTLIYRPRQHCLLSPPFSALYIPTERRPQAHVCPAGATFSAAARSQVHCPAGRRRHEQRAPATWFSTGARSQLHASAWFLPQEHFACEAGGELVTWFDLLGWLVRVREERTDHRRRCSRLHCSSCNSCWGPSW